MRFHRCLQAFLTAFAALRMTASMRAGFESMARWLLAVSSIVASMRFVTKIPTSRRVFYPENAILKR